MRGKLSNIIGRRSGAGNIPAYAGKTLFGALGGGWGAEHPRVCGENGCVGQGLAFGVGTSPRMRGKPTIEEIQGLTSRNIPAYAGKTFWRVT